MFRASTLTSATLACLSALLALPALAADKASTAAPTWDRQAAERYLDSREAWWQSWDRAQKDQGTLCVSCHTQAPFALSMPALRHDLGQSQPTSAEQAMIDSIQKRVRQWSEMKPFYSDEVYGAGKEIESRNAESVLNAVMLSSYDSRIGHLSGTARLAFSNAWALQTPSGSDAGAWVWQNFDYTPWESKESQYHWAALMAVAVATAPANYRNDPAIANHLHLLLGYLQSHFDAQPLLNKVVALRAAAYFADLLTQPQRVALLNQLSTLQRPDGGWSLADLGTWQRRDKTPLETRPDGYATAVVTLSLEENGVANANVQRGIAWLIANQDKSTGAWPAWSLNKNRDPQSDVGKFMSDAATGYAVLALTHQK